MRLSPRSLLLPVLFVAGLVFTPGMLVIRTVPGGPVVPPVATTKTVVVNANGTFTPSSVNARVGDTVRWTQMGHNDNVTRISGVPTGGQDPCDLEVTYGSITDEFSGPIRRGVPGIWAKGPPNPDVGAIIIEPDGAGPNQDDCDCEPGCTPEEVGGLKYCGSEDNETQSVPPEFWAKDGFEGTFVSIHWSEIETADGVYDFDMLDTITDLAAWHGKGVIFGFSTAGDATPSWLSGTTCSVVEVKGTNDNDPGTSNCGQEYEVINIADADCLDQVSDLYDAYHAHVIQNNRRFQAVVGFNVMGMNTLTDEVKTFWSCPDRFDNDAGDGSGNDVQTPDGILDQYNGDECFCNTQKWAEAGYTEAARDAWFVNQITHVRTLEGWGSIPFRFMMLDAGFPRVDSPTNWDGDYLCTADTVGTCTAGDMLCAGGACGATPALADDNDGAITGPSPQLDDLTATLITAFGNGVEFGNAGLDFLPQEQGASQHCTYATQQFDPMWVIDDEGVHTAQMLSEQSHISNNGFQGCPNGRAVNVGFDGYWTAWQPHNSGNLGCDTVLCQESVILNMLGSTRGTRLELYAEEIFSILFDPAIGSDEPMAPARTALGCPAGTATNAGAPPCNVAPYSKSFAEYTDEMYDRRTVFANNPAPTAIQTTFTEVGTYAYTNTKICGTDGAGGSYATITVTAL